MKKTKNTNEQQTMLLNWTPNDRIDITLQFLGANPSVIDWTGDSKVTNNIARTFSVRIGYNVVMYTPEDSLPIGSVQIIYNSIRFLDKPTIPAGSHFAEKSWDPINKVLVLENVIELEPGSTGFLNLLYQVNGRDIVSNESGILIDDNIIVNVEVTVDGDVVFTESAGPLTFKIELVKDIFSITKTAAQSIKTVDNDPDKDNPNNFYWVDYIVATTASYRSREIEKGEIIDILPKDSILISVNDFYTGNLLYNTYSGGSLVDYVSYEPDLTGDTGGKITYTFDKNDPKLIDLKQDLFKFTVKLKFPLIVGRQVKTNYAEIDGYFEGEQAAYPVLDTASANITLTNTGFSEDDGYGIYTIRKNSVSTINALSLQYNDYYMTTWNDYSYTLTKTKATNPCDIVLVDDLMNYYNNNGLVQLTDSESSFYSVDYNCPVPGINTDYDFYVRYAESAKDNFVLYRSGTIIAGRTSTLNFSDSDPRVVAFKIVYKNISEAFNNVSIASVRIRFTKTDNYINGPRAVDDNSKFINYAFLDVYRNSESILGITGSDHVNATDNFTEEELNILNNYDLETYGHYLYRVKANTPVILKAYRPFLLKYNGNVSYDSSEGLYNASFYTIVQSRWSDIMQDYTFVDILPKGFSFKSITDFIASSTHPVDYKVTVNDNYKNSGRQRVMVRITNITGAPDQIIRGLSFRLVTVIDNVNDFIPGETFTNYVGLVSKDIPYPSDDTMVGNTYSVAYRDDGTFFTNIASEDATLWYDADSDRDDNDYVWYAAGTVIIPLSPAGRSGISKYVKTNLTPYYSRIGALASLGSSYEYSLSVNNPNADMQDIIVYDTFPFIGDRFHELSDGQIVPRGSQWPGTFKDIVMSVPDGNSYPIYCTTSYEPGDLDTDPSWEEISVFLSTKTLADCKSIAVDFRGYTLTAGQFITLTVTMDVPETSHAELIGLKSVNTFYYTFIDSGGFPSHGESNSISVTIFNPTATIGDTLFYDINGNSVMEPELGETGIGNATVELYIEVDTPGEDTIEYKGYILKKVATTLTSNNLNSLGTYQFVTHESGVYFVKFINPNSTIYGAFSPKKINYDESIQVSQVDENGFTDPIIINIESSDKDISYLFADAGLISKSSEYNFEKISNEPQGSYVKMGNVTTFSIYDVENKEGYSLDNFTLEDNPHKALTFSSITIPAYEVADSVYYTIKYKLYSSDNILIVPFGENLSASVENKVDFLITPQPGDYVEKIFVEFGNVPVGFKPINGTPIVIEFITSTNKDDYDIVPGTKYTKSANNIAYLRFSINGIITEFEDEDEIKIKDCERKCNKKPCDKKIRKAL